MSQDRKPDAAPDGDAKPADATTPETRPASGEGAPADATSSDADATRSDAPKADPTGDDSPSVDAGLGDDARPADRTDPDAEAPTGTGAPARVADPEDAGTVAAGPSETSEPDAAAPAMAAAAGSAAARGADDFDERTPPYRASRDRAAEAAGPAAAPETVAEAAEADPYLEAHEHEEGGRTSFAARALQLLIVLLVGAGVGLWAAPKVAPYLPAAVAERLQPRDLVENADLAALQAELGGRLSALDSRLEELAATPPPTAEIPPERLQEAASAAVAEAADPLRDRIAALSERMGDVAPAALAERVAEAETRLSGLTAELESLGSSLADVDAEAGTMPPEATERLAAYAASLDGVRAELESLSGRVSGLSQRLEEAEAAFQARAEAADREAEAAREEAETAAARAEAADRVAAIETTYSRLTEALAAGEPFADILDAMPGETPPPEVLTAAAESGLPGFESLRADLVRAGRGALAAQRAAEAGDGALSRALAGLTTALSGVPVTETEGDGPAAAIGRAGARLERGDLDGAIAALDGLPEPAATELAPWLERARARRDAADAAEGWRDALVAAAS